MSPDATTLPPRHRSRLFGIAAAAGLATVVASREVGRLRRELAAARAAAPAAPPRPIPAPATATPPPRRKASTSFKTTKRVLVLVMLAGIAAYVGGGGAFGSFSAETTNAGSTASSGTLTMSDQVNSGTACISNDLTNGTNNVNPSCGAILTLSNLAPGVFVSTATATVTIQNTGSINASKLWLWAPPNSTTLSGGLTSGNPVTSLSVNALGTAVTTGQSVIVSSGANTQAFVASSGASVGATSVSVTSQNANFSYPSASAVNVADCLDAKTTVGGSTGSTKGTDLNFNPTSGNPFCSTALIWVQEQTGTTAGSPGTHNYCWLGANYGDASGMCVAPISVNLSSGLSTGGAITSLPVAALNGNVRSGDSVVVTSGTNTQTFTATANAYIGATSIAVSSTTPNFAYPTSSTVTDTTTLGTLNSDTTDTIMRFDTLHNGAQGPIELKTVTANGTLQSSGPTTELGTGAAAARTFLIGVYFPQPAGVNQNALQGLSATFGMTWHIDQ